MNEAVDASADFKRVARAFYETHGRMEGRGIGVTLITPEPVGFPLVRQRVRQPIAATVLDILRRPCKANTTPERAGFAEPATARGQSSKRE